jgi:hypothetical protein
MFHEFTLKGADGKSHSYILEPLPPTVGLPIFYRLSAKLGEPILQLIHSALLGKLSEAITEMATADDVDGDEKKKKTALDLGVTDLIAAVKDIDPAKLADALTKALTDPALASDTRMLLSKANRDNEDMSKDVYYDQAFQCNYIELVSAAMEAAIHNGFLPSWLIDAIRTKIPRAVTTPLTSSPDAPSDAP